MVSSLPATTSSGRGSSRAMTSMGIARVGGARQPMHESGRAVHASAAARVRPECATTRETATDRDATQQLRDESRPAWRLYLPCESCDARRGMC